MTTIHKRKILSFTKKYISITLMLVLVIQSSLLKGQEQVVTAVVATKMNVLYANIDNPVSIAVTGVAIDKTTATVDNGTIKGSKGEYIINPGIETMPATVKVFAGGKEVKQVKFRVKRVPDPVASIKGIKSSGKISKQDLLKQDSITVQLENFDFDAKFKVKMFAISATLGGFTIIKYSMSGKITNEQKELISKVGLNQKIYVEDIRCIGPENKERQLNAIILTITE